MTISPGRLSDEERLRLEALIDEKPEVRHRVEFLQSQEEVLRHLGEDILNEPLPERLLEALGLDGDSDDSDDAVEGARG